MRTPRTPSLDERIDRLKTLDKPSVEQVLDILAGVVKKNQELEKRVTELESLVKRLTEH